MSLMKQFMMESEELADRAALIAWTTNDNQRITEFHDLYADCETAARAYADPYEVAGQFKALITATFYQSRQVVLSHPIDVVSVALYIPSL